MIIRKVTSRWPRGDHRNFALLGEFPEHVPGLALKHPLPCYQQGTLSLADHVNSLLHVLSGRMSPRFASILVFAVVVLQPGWISKASSGNLPRKIQMNGSGYAGLHIAKGIAAVL